MTTRKKTLSKWTWTNSLLFTLLICNLAAIAWYFWSLPEQNWDHSKKVIGTLASWSVSVLTFFGIRHTVAKNITVTAFLSMLPARLVIILVSVALWLFCLPFHSLTITVLDGRLPLEGATVRLDGSISRRYGATDALGRIHLGGLAAAEHNMVVEKSDYEPAQAKASFADVLAWRADHAISLTRAMGTLDISSDPSGAVIFLDGDHRNSVGTTPKSVPVSSGKHAVLVEMQGYGSALLGDGCG